MTRIFKISVLPACLLNGATAVAQEAVARPDAPSTPQTARPVDSELGGQITFIGQRLFTFKSPYQGVNSLRSKNEFKISDTYTLFLGKRLTPRFEVFFNPEMARGGGIGTALGLAGYANGDVIRNPQIGQEPYVARAFVRYTAPTGHTLEDGPPGENLIPGKRATDRLTVTFGKLGSNDLFDTNAYANGTRTQFMNWALINNAAYDYAADTRGYTTGVGVEWMHPTWAVRVGSFQMPTFANGPVLSMNLQKNRGDQIELETHPSIVKHKDRSTLRILGYRNLADMGNYRDALALGAKRGTTPDVTATRREGSVKYGVGMNFEQPLGDGGDTGAFARAAWNDGRTESFAYTEAETSLTVGLQVSGKRWRRPSDKWAIALEQNGLGADHRAYLAAGGLGFILGDGKLSYRPERILETYYTFQADRTQGVSLDLQYIVNPGYNQDRGPVPVFSVRYHWEF